MKTLRTPLVYVALALESMLFSNIKENIHLKTNHMKKFFSIITILFLLGIPVKAQWNQKGTGLSSLTDPICVVNDSVIWIKDQIGDKFSITTNGGNSWKTKNLPASFLNPVGYAGGSLSAVSSKTAFFIQSISTATSLGGVYKTTDGGDTWNRQSTAFNSASSFPDLVYFWNENEGVAIGDGIVNGVMEIYTTTNGGVQWNLVPTANMPMESQPVWSINTNKYIRVKGNTIYVLAELWNDHLAIIYKSTNKGLSWSEIKTPIPMLNASFDFKDDFNGLLSNYDATKKKYSLYSTSNGGSSWAIIDSTSNIGDLQYIPSKNSYFSTNYSLGIFAYSDNDGINWTKNASFSGIGLYSVASTPSGRIFVGGRGTIYSSDNYKGVNVAANQAIITGSKSIDILFSGNVDIASAQDTASYVVDYRQMKDTSSNWIYEKIRLSSATVDNTNKSLVHLVANTDLPIDTIYTRILSVKGLDGFLVLSKSISIIHNNLTNYANSKFALIGSSYFLDNMLGGTKASWNTCWKDSKNNIQPSVPVVSGSGLIYTWNFPGVYLDGVNQGMFKFCTPNSDNTTPNWSISPIGSVEITKYTGNAAADVDRTTDANGAFIILTAGAIKQYDLQLIIDQTSGKDVFTLNANYSDATGIPLISESVSIVQYNVYSILGRLVSSGASENGLTIQNLKQKLTNGIYIIKAKLSNGQIRNLKVQIK